MKDKVLGVMAGVLVLFGVYAVPAGIYYALNDPEPPQVQSVETEVPSADIEVPPSFEGYECTDDCSGHEAGYDWAEQNDVCDPEFDGGNSQSFAEGVRAYAYDNCYYSDGDSPI